MGNRAARYPIEVFWYPRPFPRGRLCATGSGLLAAALVGFNPGNSPAAQIDWDGGNTETSPFESAFDRSGKVNWNDTANWKGNVKPGASDGVNIDDSWISGGIATSQQIMNEDFTVQYLKFNSPNMIGLGSDNSSPIVNHTLTLKGASTDIPLISLGSSYTGQFAYLGGNVSGRGAVTVQLDSTANNKVDVPFDHVLWITGLVTGSGSLRLVGQGTVLLGTATDVSPSTNTFSGGVVVNSGALAFGSSTTGTVTNGPIGTGTLTLNGGSIFSSVAARTIANAVQVSGDFSIAGPHALTLTGPITLSGGTRTLDVQATTTLSGVLSGTVGLTKSGTGTLTLASTSNSFSGGVTINAGTLIVSSIANSGSNSGLGSGSAVTLNGGTLRYTDGTTSTNRALTIGSGGGTIDTNTSSSTILTVTGTLSGSGALTKAGAGKLVVNNVRLPGLTVSAGTLRIADSLGDSSTSVLPALPTVGGSAMFDLNDSALIVQFGTGSSPLSQTRAAVVAGRGATDFGNATWQGNGGIASAAAAPGGIGDGTNAGDGISFALGYVENSYLYSLGLASYTSFAGQTVDSGSMLIRFTRGADCNLDGHVNTDDLTIVGSLYNTPGTGQWFFGDFDYDGIVDSDDSTLLGALYEDGGMRSEESEAQLIAQITAQYGEEFATYFEIGRQNGVIGNNGFGGGGMALMAAPVPEPTFALIAGIGAIGLLKRSRRGR